MKQTQGSRALIISAFLAILLALGYTAWWVSFALSARSGVEQWAQQRRAEGWQVSFADITLRGYPFALTMRLAQPRIAEPGGLSWQGPDVAAVISPLRPSNVLIRAAGKHELAIAGVDTVSLEAGSAQARLELNARGRVTGGSAGLQNVTATSRAGPSSLDSLQIEIEDMVPPNSRIQEAIPSNLAFGIALSNLSLPSQFKLPLGRRLAAATLRGRVRGQWEPVPFTMALANWRDGGGVIEMDEMMLRWDPLTLNASGTLALDQRLQPLIAVTARAGGFFETVDALAAAKIIRSRDASMTKLVLGALSKQPADGGPAVLEMPLTIQDGVFYAAGLALARVPDLPWEAPVRPPIPGRVPPPEPAKPELAKPGITVGPQGEVTRAK